jgi:hypothetical protein
MTSPVPSPNALGEGQGRGWLLCLANLPMAGHQGPAQYRLPGGRSGGQRCGVRGRRALGERMKAKAKAGLPIPRTIFLGIGHGCMMMHNKPCGPGASLVLSGQTERTGKKQARRWRERTSPLSRGEQGVCPGKAYCHAGACFDKLSMTHASRNDDSPFFAGMGQGLGR